MRKIFLLSLALALVLVLAPAPDAAAGSCSAQQSCSDGSSISCTGSSSCLVGADYVECDGTRTTCPGCDATYTCPTPEYDQAYVLYCSTSSGTCSVDNFNDSVTCGSTTRTCAGCQAGLYPCIVPPTLDCNYGAWCSRDSDCGSTGFCSNSQCACF